MKATPPHNVEPKTQARRVLIVDDEPAILFAYQKLIQTEGFEADICEDLDEALRLISKYSYFAVITDVRLTGCDDSGGVHLAQAVRRQQPDAKIIIISGFGNGEIDRILKELGASRYFEKPVNPSLIMDFLKICLVASDERVDEFEFGLRPSES